MRHAGGPFRRFVRFAKYFVVNAYFRLLLLLPYKHLRKFLKIIDGVPASHTTARWIGYHVYMSAKFVPGSTCLSRGLCAQYFLKRQGFSSQMKIGVSQTTGAMTAHAWVLSGGHVVVGNEEGQLETHTVLAEIGSKNP